MERFCLFFTDILSVNTPHLNETNLVLTSMCLNVAKSLILSLGLNSRNDVPWRTPPGQENFSPLGFKIVLKIICFSKKKSFWVSCPFFLLPPPRPRQQTGPVLAPDPPAPPDAGPEVESFFLPPGLNIIYLKAFKG